MQPLQQVLEHAVGVVVILLASSEGAAQRRGDSGLVRQALDADYTPFHGKLGRLLPVRFMIHSKT